MAIPKGSKFNFNNFSSYFIMALIPLRPIISINVFNILMILYIIYNFYIILLRGKIKVSPISMGFLFFLIYGFFSIFYSHYLTGTGYVLRKMIPIYFFGFCLSQNIVYNNKTSIEKSNTINRIFISYVSSTVLVSIYLLLFELPLLGVWGKLGRILYVEEGLTVYSYHLIISTSYIIYLLICNKYNKYKKIFLFIIFSILLISSLLTSVRKTIIAPIIVFATIMYIKNKRDFGRLLLGGIITLILCIGIYYIIMNNVMLYNIIGIRMQSLMSSLLGSNYSGSDYIDESGIERDLLRENAWNLFKQFPFFGYGIDGFKFYTGNNGTNALYAHNNYLELLASTGIVGFSLYYGSIVVTLKKLILLFNEKKNEVFILPISFIILQIFLDYGTVSYYSYVYIPFYFIIGTYVELKSKEGINEPTIDITISNKSLLTGR